MRWCRRAFAAVWHEGLSAAAEEALDRLREHAVRTLDQVESARVETLRPVTDNRLARMLVLSLGLKTAHETRGVRDLVEAAEAELHDAQGVDQRRIALRWVGAVVALRGDIPELELMEATARIDAGLPRDAGERLELADSAARALAGLVVTDDRRAAVRNAAVELARFACGGVGFHRRLGRRASVGRPGRSRWLIGNPASRLVAQTRRRLSTSARRP